MLPRLKLGRAGVTIRRMMKSRAGIGVAAGLLALASAAGTSRAQEAVDLHAEGYLATAREIRLEGTDFASKRFRRGQVVIGAPITKTVADIGVPLGSLFPEPTGKVAAFTELLMVEKPVRPLRAMQVQTALACDGGRQRGTRLYMPGYKQGLFADVIKRQSFCLADRDGDGRFELAVVLDRYNNASERPIDPVPYKLRSGVPYSATSRFELRFDGLTPDKRRAQFQILFHGMVAEGHSSIVQWTSDRGHGEIMRKFDIGLSRSGVTRFELMGMRFEISGVADGSITMSAQAEATGRLFYRAVWCMPLRDQSYWCEPG
jgi:hypothetical protein